MTLEKILSMSQNRRKNLNVRLRHVKITIGEAVQRKPATSGSPLNRHLQLEDPSNQARRPYLLVIYRSITYLYLLIRCEPSPYKSFSLFVILAVLNDQEMHSNCLGRIASIGGHMGRIRYQSLFLCRMRAAVWSNYHRSCKTGAFFIRFF
jgi:hypothetical protein